MKKRKPPEHLSKNAKAWFNRILKEYELEDSGLIILVTALECWDEYQACKKRIDEEGATIMQESGVYKKNPNVELLKIARGHFLQSWRLLGFQNEPPSGIIGRPPGDRGRYEEED